MRIAILPSWYPRDPSDVEGVFFRDQALALKGYGHQVAVLAVNTRSVKTFGRRQMDSIRYEIDDGIPTYRTMAWGISSKLPLVDFLLWRRAAKRLFDKYVEECELPEVIHAHCGVYAGAVAAEISKAHNLPLVLTEHSSSFARNSYRSWQLRLARRATEGADARIAVSPSLAEVLEENLYSGNRRWIWIPNVVADRFSSETLEEERNGRGVRLLSLGMMLRHKGQIELVRAFARAFGPGDDVELWFGGDGPALAGVKAEAEALALAGRVRFLGRVRPAEVPMLLGSVDALVIASHYETFGVAAAESLMVGKPVLATRSGGPECIVGREDGLLVEPKNVAALAEGLKKLVGNLDGYSASGLAERARARFGAQAVAEKLTRVYRRVQERGDIGDWKP